MPSPKLFIQDGHEHREFTDAEYAQHGADVIEDDRQKDLVKVKAADRQAILDRLGITSDEAAIVLGL